MPIQPESFNTSPESMIKADPDNNLKIRSPDSDLIITLSGLVINAKGEIVKMPQPKKKVTKTKETK